ncbi:DUF433 domain-containing protein [Oscillatoria sp. FACHB-1407]|uniref:DUF433 domain-containing protein n=1 Tax=Oscillatoria sp. FACHB-1407 TaxID=2692847 RepID=UPI001684D6D4|nr:DUF433 domain-containing protein [Oscillatoria sp. FACHB-1407]MBD2464477.1 DUF433 domain-containing protein [Oscillatoria sp. FACHB-1407]
MEIAPHINIDPEIHHGKPVITGTRVPVSLAIGSLASGMTMEEVIKEYELTIEQLQAALAYAANLVAQTDVIPLGA